MNLEPDNQNAFHANYIKPEIAVSFAVASGELADEILHDRALWQPWVEFLDEQSRRFYASVYYENFYHQAFYTLRWVIME